MAISFKSLSSSSKSQKTSIITGTSSWTAPADVTYVDLVLVGAGGGSSGHHTGYIYGGGGGGGGGQVLKKTVTVTPGSSYTVTIGAGGSAGYISSGTSNTIDRHGYAGGNTTFGSLATAFGGGGGVYVTNGYWGRNPVGYNGGGEGANNTSITVGGGGGGAGSSPYGASGSIALSNTTYRTMAFAYTTGGNPGAAGAYSNYGWGQPIMGGKGIDGFGGGGSAGCANYGLSSPYLPSGQYYIPAPDGGGYGYYDGGSGGANGAANTGGGGGGSGSGNSTNGSGGSGIAIIKYWTAT